MTSQCCEVTTNMSAKVYTLVLCLYLLKCVESSLESYIQRKDPKTVISSIYSQNRTNEVASMGCRTVPHTAVLVRESKLMTAIWCTKECWAEKQYHAYIKKGELCLCGGEEVGEDVPDAECNIPCSNARTQNCGGHNVAFTMATGYVGLEKWRIHELWYYILGQKYLSGREQNVNDLCVRWKPRRRLYFSTELMTKSICLIHCYYNKFRFAAIAVGRVCICTSEDLPPKPPSRTPAQILAQGEKDVCNLKCKGGGEDICGGEANVYTVWSTGHTNKADAHYKGYFVAKLALNQNWNQFLTDHPAITRELSTGVGVELKLPPGFNASHYGDPEVEVEDAESEDTLSTTVIVGLVLGAVAFVIIFIAVSQCCKKRMTRKKNIEEGSDDDESIPEKQKKKSPAETKSSPKRAKAAQKPRASQKGKADKRQERTHAKDKRRRRQTAQ